MNNNPIGILDSGVGGLTVLKAIAKELPDESFVYIGDSANTPYGSKSKEEICARTSKLVDFLISKQVKLIVVACNSSTVSCLEELRKEYPDMPFIGTVPVIKTAAAVSKNRRIGVLSTTTTAKSDYQKRLIEEFASDCTVFSHGSDDLVPLIERGKERSEEMTHVLTKVLKPFQEEGIDALVLGCTHFPFVEDQMQDIMGKDVQLLDSGGAIARQVRRVLEQNNSLAGEHPQTISIFTTGSIDIPKKLLQDTFGNKAVEYGTYAYEYNN
ncbi:MAG TPA: glutamate racemase [Candidatus Saccharimonadales bacterium]|nr:glutamate racemase [Candidatus Saccharimonadales bacterium]